MVNETSSVTTSPATRPTAVYSPGSSGNVPSALMTVSDGVMSTSSTLAAAKLVTVIEPPHSMEKAGTLNSSPCGVAVGVAVGVAAGVAVGVGVGVGSGFVVS